MNHFDHFRESHAHSFLHLNGRRDACAPRIVCMFLVSFLPLTGCTPRDASNDLLRSSSPVMQTYAGHPIRLSLTVSDPSCQKAKKVEVTVDQAVDETLSEHDISSAKIELEPTFKNNALELEIPTTESFKPGIWHVSELRFYQPDKKVWVTCKEGMDYAGLPFRLINNSNADTPKQGKVRLEKVEMVSQ